MEMIYGMIHGVHSESSPVSKLPDLLQQKLGGLEGRTKRRMAMKIATVASVTYLRREVTYG